MRLVLAISFFACYTVLASTNQITREIYCKGGVARVRDSIRLPLELCRYLTILAPIVTAKEASSTDLSRAVGRLYLKDNLEVENFDAKIDRGTFQLSVSS